jgi:hypothetical protein
MGGKAAKSLVIEEQINLGKQQEAEFLHVYSRKFQYEGVLCFPSIVSKIISRTRKSHADR